MADFTHPVIKPNAKIPTVEFPAADPLEFPVDAEAAEETTQPE